MCFGVHPVLSAPEGTRIPTKCTTRNLKVPGYQQSVQPGKGIPRYQRVYNLEKNVPRYQQSVHVVGILVCFPGSANLAVNLHIVSTVQ